MVALVLFLLPSNLYNPHSPIPPPLISLLPPVNTPISLPQSVSSYHNTQNNIKLANKNVCLNLEELIKPNKKNFPNSYNNAKQTPDLNYGNRSINVESADPDTLRANEAKHTLAHTINSQGIDIACIQETHNGRIDSEIVTSYATYYGGCEQVKHTNAKTNTQLDETNNNQPNDATVIAKTAYRAGISFAISNELIPLLQTFLELTVVWWK